MKKNIFILLVSLLVLLPSSVNALNGSLKLTCDKETVSLGDKVNCTITGSSDFSVSAIMAPVVLSDGVSIVSFQPSSEWQGSDVNSGKIEIYPSCSKEDDGDCTVTGGFNVGTLVLQVSDSASLEEKNVQLVDFELMNDKDEVHKASSNKVTMIMENKVLKGLSNLTITGGTLSPKFENTTTGYSISLTEDVFTINVTLNNSNDKVVATVDGKGVIKLGEEIKYADYVNKEQGEILLEIAVGEGDNLVTYELIVTKESTGEDNLDNSLATLTIGGKNIDLELGKTIYSVSLDSNKGYEVKATLSDPDNFEFVDGNGTWIGSGDVFTIEIVPKNSESGGTRIVYTIEISSKDSGNDGNGNNTGGGSSDKNDDDNSNNNTNNDNQNTNSNPPTGSTTFVVSIILILSFIITITLYRKNIDGYNNN